MKKTTIKRHKRRTKKGKPTTVKKHKRKVKKRMAFKEKTTIPLADYPESFGYTGETKHITPAEFMRLAQQTSTDPEWKSMSPEKYEKEIIFEPKMARIVEGIAKKEKVVPIGYIEFKDNIPVDHEGRHRAVAAKRLGVEQIPVRFIYTK